MMDEFLEEARREQRRDLEHAKELAGLEATDATEKSDQ